MKTTRWVLAVAIGLIALVAPSAARADTLTYTQTSVLSGTLDGTPFNSSLVTFTLTGDTSTISSNGLFLQVSGPATVSVAGMTDTFTDNMAVFTDQSVSVGCSMA